MTTTSDSEVVTWSNDVPKVDPVWGPFLSRDDVGIQLSPTSQAGKKQVACTSNKLNQLPFSSSKNAARFGPNPSTDGYTVNATPNGMPGILMALDMDVPKPGDAPLQSVNHSWPFEDMLDLFGVDLPDPQDPEVQLMDAIMTAIKLDKVFHVDPSEPRSGIWLFSGETLNVTTLLSFTIALADVEAVVNSVAVALGTHFSLNLSNAKPLQIQIQQRTLGRTMDDGEMLVLSLWALTVKIPISGFVFWVNYTPGSVECTLTEDHSTSGDLITRLKGLGSHDLDSDSVQPKYDSVLSDKFDLWYLTIGKETGQSAYFEVSLLVTWTVKDTPILLGISYDSRTETFLGELLFKGSIPTSDQKLLPSYDPRKELPSALSDQNALAVTGLQDHLDLVTLFSDASSRPPGILTTITRAQVAFQASKPKTISLSVGLGSLPDPPTHPVPAHFQWNFLDFTGSRVEGADGGISFEISSSVSLIPDDLAKYETGTLWVDLTYVKGSWSLTGRLSDLQFGALGGFFPDGLKQPFIDVLGDLTIKSLEVDYTFTKPIPGSASSVDASSFLFSGSILLGELELDLVYQCVSSSVGDGQSTAAQTKLGNGGKALPPPPQDSPAVWSFDAELGAASTGTASTTIGSIADSIVRNSSAKLPAFVSKIEVKPTGKGTSPISVKITPAKGGKGVNFVLKIAIGVFEALIVQIANPNAPPKRIFRITCSQLPLIDKIPLVKELPQPFDKLVYMWVLDESGVGWTAGDISTINGDIDSPDSQVLGKEVNNPTPGTDASKLSVILPGHHFMVIDHGVVVLDHVFGQADEKPPEQSQDKHPDDPPAAAADTTPQPTKGALSKKTNFVTISNVGLQYKDGQLSVLMDASAELGPISVDLLGFGFSVPISDFTLDKLQDIASHITPMLHGLGIAFDKPPLTLAGIFEYEDDPTLTTYRGGIAVSYIPYVFMAVGEYQEVKTPPAYKSLFIFAKLDGPLVTLEFATIGGVRLGFGYNSLVRTPALEELNDFPFINDSNAGVSGAGNNPINVLNAMTGGANPWVSRKEDSYWFAAGMTVSAFDLLAITAVALFSFNDAGIVVAIYADAIAQMPPKVPPDETILYVEIAMAAELNFIDDLFRVEASIAPTSFILVPQCHLYGGFAMCYWFGSNPHAGDWMFSVGGYHRAYTPPLWYPNPKRLGVNFQVGDGLSVTAEAYFAITPKTVMGGATLHVSLDVGPVSAYLDAAFDAMINFEPFHYTVDMRIAIGIECNIDILFIHIHIHVQVGADLHIEGPQFGGVAHVDFYLFGFDVYFGDSTGVPAKLTFPAFYELVQKAGPPTSTPTADATDKTLEYLQFNLEDGAYPIPQRDAPVVGKAAPPTPNAGTGTGWYVRGGTFRFRISSTVAIARAQVDLDDSKIEPVVAPTSLNDIYSRPMQLREKIDSNLVISITSIETNERIPHFVTSYVIKSVPTAIWGQYDQDQDPVNSKNPDALRQHLYNGDGATVDLAMAVSLLSPPPILAKSLIPVFDPTAAANRRVRDKITDEEISRIAPTEATQDVFLPQPTPNPLDPAVPPESGPVRWATARQSWHDAFNAELVGDGHSDGGGGMLGLCADMLEWKLPDPVKSAGSVAPVAPQTHDDANARKPWELVGAFPSKLVVGKVDAQGVRTGGLEEYYLALPGFCAALAA